MNIKEQINKYFGIVNLNTQRNSFFIHTREQAGSAGNASSVGYFDLWDKNELFFEKLLSYMKQYKYVKQYKKVFLGYVEQYNNEILNNQGKIL